MLKPAQLYKEELNRKYIETWYDDKYKFYRSDPYAGNISIPNNNSQKHSFVCIDDKGSVIGYFSYSVNWEVKSICNFGLISFIDNNNCILIKDIIRQLSHMIKDVGFKRIEFWAFKDNPANKGYSKIVKRYGGSQVAELHNVAMLSDGKLHDMVIYEILFEDKE
jgi:hypothetical protein